MMWRSLEPHISAYASWQVGDFCFLHESSQGAGGEEAGGKVTQVWGWAGRQGWGGYPGMRGQGGCPVGRCGQLRPGSPLPQQVLAGLPADLCTETRPGALGNKLLLESQGQNTL